MCCALSCRATACVSIPSFSRSSASLMTLVSIKLAKPRALAIPPVFDEAENRTPLSASSSRSIKLAALAACTPDELIRYTDG